MERLVHCFGSERTHRVDTDLAVDMLRASGCRHLAVNTHSIDEVARGDELPVGYGSATLASVLAAAPELQLRPVLNINLPTTAREAIDRTRRAVDMTGITTIKLEVLTDDLRLSNDDAVLDAAATLLESSLVVWPLIGADVVAFDCAQSLGCSLVRVMGSPIGSLAGIGSENEGAIAEILARKQTPVMFDGGVGGVEDARAAIELGFDSVLVNSCLFTGDDPVTALAEIRAAVDAAGLAHEARA